VKIDAKRGLHHAVFRSVVDLPKRQEREARSWRGARVELPAWSLIAQTIGEKRTGSPIEECKDQACRVYESDTSTLNGQVASSTVL